MLSPPFKSFSGFSLTLSLLTMKRDGDTPVANTTCFHIQRGAAEKLRMKTKNFFSLCSIIPGATWSNAKSDFSDVGSIWNSPDANELTKKHVWLRGRITFFSDAWTVFSGTFIQFCSLIWSCTVAVLLRVSISIGGECLETTFFQQRKFVEYICQWPTFSTRRPLLSLPEFRNILALLIHHILPTIQ